MPFCKESRVPVSQLMDLLSAPLVQVTPILAASSNIMACRLTPLPSRAGRADWHPSGGHREGRRLLVSTLGQCHSPLLPNSNRLIEKPFLLHAGSRDSSMSSSGQGRTAKAGSHLFSKEALGCCVSLSSHFTTAAEAIDQTSTQPCLATRLVGSCLHHAWPATCQHCLLSTDHVSLQARNFYAQFLDQLKAAYVPEKVHDGVFAAMMDVALVNDGPVTIVLDSSKAHTQG